MIAHRGGADIIRKSALKVDSGNQTWHQYGAGLRPDAGPPELSCPSAVLDEELVPA